MRYGILLLVLASLVMIHRVMGQKYETQPFDLVETFGDMEVRYYPPVMKIQSDNSFGALFDYISGGNDGQTEIQMTTPVYMGDAAGNAVMEFVLPTAFDTTNTPSPTSAGVRVFESKAGYFAALSFGGYARSGKTSRAIARLRRLVAEHGLSTTGAPLLLVYNAPLEVLGRKNEVLLQLADWEGSR